MTTYYWVCMHTKKGTNLPHMTPFHSQILARKHCIWALEYDYARGQTLAQADIYKSASTNTRGKLIGSVHIDRGLPEYIDSDLRPHPLNKDGSFKKKGVC